MKTMVVLFGAATIRFLYITKWEFIMNEHVGFTGGSILMDVGTEYDFLLFFECINSFVAKKYPNKNWSVITDRLYRKYLASNELDIAYSLMNEIQVEFRKIPINAICIDYSKSRLRKMENGYLYNLFYDFFHCFFDCLESSKYSFEESRKNEDYRYEPVFTINAQIPFYIMDKMKNLTEYDRNEGRPFWCSDN